MRLRLLKLAVHVGIVCLLVLVVLRVKQNDTSRQSDSKNVSNPSAAGATVPKTQQDSEHAYLPLITHETPPTAFPGAQGYGAEAVGGRGGRILEVTNLNDSGPGSLRAAVEAEGPRIVVFRVAGNIVLNKELEIKSPYLTIAGQTAPGGGITLRRPDGDGGLLIKIRGPNVHDIVIRYLRIRSGKGEAGNGDNLTINYGYNIVIDHVSFEWSNDEQIGITPAPNGTPIQNVTIQHSIIAEALRPHSTAALLKWDPGDPMVSDFSIHHNLFAHNAHRQPRIRAAKRVKFVNNVIYNWNSKVGSTESEAQVDFIGNFVKVGPWSDSNDIWFHHPYPKDQPNEPFPDPSLYLAGNVAIPTHTDPSKDNWSLIRNQWTLELLPEQFRRYQPLQSPLIPIAVQPATDAYTTVMADVGANARLDCEGNWVPALDSVDMAIIDHVANVTGPATNSQADHQNDYGGYPEIDPGSPCPDTDHDGMPDAWEQIHGFDPHSAEDASANADNDNFTNVEEYLNGTTP